MKTIKRWIRLIRGNSWHINTFILYFIVLLGWGAYISYSTACLKSDSDYWETISKQFTRENIFIPAARGSILSSNGQILSASVPEYRLYLDFRVVSSNEKTRDKLQHQKDSIFDDNIDSIAHGLAQIFPSQTENWFKRRLEQGKKNHMKRLREKEEPGSCTWMIYNKTANHIQYKACLELPLFREKKAISGFHAEPISKRIRPNGDLASRTVGSLFPETDSAKCGLELSYDSILRGVPGTAHSIRVRNKQITVIDKEAVSGNDLLTTIDIGLQDYVDQALRKKLKEEGVNGEIGVAVLMEVKTGDIKAIANLKKGSDGEYYEMKNHAVSDLMEPGSTFKTASMMVAMEDGYITENTVVDCMLGTCDMHGRPMKDHNWAKGGYGNLTVSEILEQSSNIGVSKIIDRYYQDSPQRFIDGLLREGVGLPLNLPFVGKGEPIVPTPSSTKRYWSKTDLPWMSIGYVTMQPPISTLTFYNAIANDGTMVKPRFVKAELSNGKVVKEYPTEVIKQKICSTNTLSQIQRCLEHVVSRGLGKKAGNGGKLFPVSGKTGTALYAVNGGYCARKYMISFCGYFPSDAPKYSCIVCIVKSGLPASGGVQCGPVFSDIAKFAMGHGMFREPSKEVFDVESKLLQDDTERIHDNAAIGQMPNVIGMGARDAVFILQKHGLRVRLNGAGKVFSQSIPYKRNITKGEEVTITLSKQ